jgi:hypothetical protein
VVSGTYNTQLSVINNDFNEGEYTVALQASGFCAPYTTTVSVNPSPAVPGQTPNTIYLGYGPSTVQLTANANSFAPYSYSWTPVGATSQSVNVGPTTTTNYSVNVLNAYGCPSGASQMISVVDIRDGNKNKVFICHNGHTNSVSVNAIQAHLAHGDQLGNCDLFSRNAIVDLVEGSAPALYPNPASNETMVVVKLKEADRISVTVVDANGKMVLPVVEESFKAGEQRISLNTTSLRNGTYLVRVATKAGLTNVKLVVLH